MRQWWRHRQYLRSFHPRRRRKRWVVRKVVGDKVYGYWRGSEKYNGATFTSDPTKAKVFTSRQSAQSNADNTMLYKHSNYRVERLQKR